MSIIPAVSKLTFEQLITRLDETVPTKGKIDPKNYLIFKESKRALKEMARKGELSDSRRARILAILSRKGFRAYVNDPKFRGCSIQPTPLLLYSPKLWDILFHPENYPDENKILNALPLKAYKTLISGSEGSPENMIEITKVAKLLGLPEVEIHYTEILKKVFNEPSLTIRSFYYLAILFPDYKLERSIVEKLPLHFRMSLPNEVSMEEIAGECKGFEAMDTKAIEDLSSEALYRFFFYAQEGSTRLAALDALLMSLKAGTLDLKYCKPLIAEAQKSVDLHKRLNQDQLTLSLEGIGDVTLCLWPLFAESDYLRSMLGFGSCAVEKIFLEGNKALGFLHFYEYLIKGNQCPPTLSTEELFGVLECIEFFQVKGHQDKREFIVKAILSRVGNSPESMAELAEIGSSSTFSELEENVLEWLNNTGMVTIQRNGERCAVQLFVMGDHSFSTIQSTIGVLKVLKENDRISQIDLESNSESLLNLICGIYCCNELGQLVKKKELEGKLLQIGWHEEKPFQDNPLKTWSPLAIIFLLKELSDPATAHLLDLFVLINEYRWVSRYSEFWKIVSDFAKGENLPSLRNEVAVFEKILAGEGKLSDLSKKGFPCFLFFFPLEELEERREEIVLELSRRIKEGEIHLPLLKRATEDCRTLDLENADFINQLPVQIGCNESTVEMPLELLMKMKCLNQVFSTGGFGKDFDDLPIESVQWAINCIKGIIRDKKGPKISAEERLPPSHFRALQRVQREFFDYPYEEMKSCAAALCSSVSVFSKETLPAVAAWAYSLFHEPLFNTCAQTYCGNKDLILKDNGHEVRIIALKEKPMQMLKAIGIDLRRLHIDYEPKKGVLAYPWADIVNSCPNLEHLTLYLEGPILLSGSIALDRLTKLRWLTLNPRGVDVWKSLCNLKIPSVEHMTLFGNIEDIKETAPYEFFSKLPPKGVRLSIDWSPQKPESKSLWSYVWAGTDPASEIFRNIRHCTELEVNLGTNNRVNDIIINGFNLEKLELSCQDFFPNVNDLSIITEDHPKLKKCEIKISLFNKESKEQLESFLSKASAIKNLQIELSGLYSPRLNRYHTSTKSPMKLKVHVFD